MDNGPRAPQALTRMAQKQSSLWLSLFPSVSLFGSRSRVPHRIMPRGFSFSPKIRVTSPEFLFYVIMYQMANTKPLVLLIDDSDDFREIVSLRLGAAGFETVQANRGEAGIEKLKNIKPDLVVLDMEMPGLNGVETLMKIKDDPATKDAKVVFLTSYGEPQEKMAEVDQKFAAEVGALCYIRKTDDMNHIIREITEHATSAAPHINS